jgi:hypothetical protein
MFDPLLIIVDMHRSSFLERELPWIQIKEEFEDLTQIDEDYEHAEVEWERDQRAIDRQNPWTELQSWRRR